jgi:hypothetical protein
VDQLAVAVGSVVPVTDLYAVAHAAGASASMAAQQMKAKRERFNLAEDFFIGLNMGLGG